MRLSDVLTTEERYRAILNNHLPLSAVEWVYNYLNKYKIHFHITRQRISKLGDYRWPQPYHQFHEISVNGDLSPHLFFWVFLHEAAHLETHLKYSQAQPHGHEWQNEYACLLKSQCIHFPVEVQPLISLYVSHIPLNRRLSKQIENMLQPLSRSSSKGLILDELEPHSRFILPRHPAMIFENIEHRRTRWLCRETATGRLFTVSGMAEVYPVAENLTKT